MHTIRLPNGRAIPWSEYRAMMLKRRNPVMAYDAKPAWLARDQNNGGLTRVYTNATNEHLAKAGVSAEDCDVISRILEK
jgi:hypothetical protein